MSRNSGVPAPISAPPTAPPDPAIVRHALDLALDDWWRNGELPPLLLVRDSLLLLEAGGDLDDAQRSLLLRTCIAARKGMLTALRYQSDPARTALILADALLQLEAPLRPEEVNWLRNQDSRSDEWFPALMEILREEVGGPDSARAGRAQAALAGLEGAVWLEPVQAEDLGLFPRAVDGTAPLLRRTWVKALAALAIVAAVVALLFWQQQQARMQDLVVIPAGVYPPAGELAAFAIDRNEVTLANYRRCYDQGVCTWPAADGSARRPTYALDPAFEQYPVVNVDWAAASRYCTWAGKRLPTVEEWEVAAGFAPATQRRYRFPWGDQFIVQAANSAPAGIGDTQVVRSYQPIGDSPFGLSDMAGNVAEWTATTGEGGYVVKGGSYQDEAGALEVAARHTLDAATAEPWLGFRCAATMAPASESRAN